MALNESLKNILIGVFVVSASFLVFISLFYITPDNGDQGKMLRVRFTNVDKVNVGTRVTFAGRPIGTVIEFFHINKEEEQPIDELGNIYFYELTLALDSSIAVYSTDEISTHTSGLMGERSIEIRPKARTEHSYEVSDGGLMYAEAVGGMEAALGKFSDVGTKVESTVDAILHILDKNDDNIAETISSLESSSDSLEKLLEKANTLKLIENTNQTMKNLETVTTYLSNELQKLSESHATENLGSLINHTNNIIASFDQPEKMDAIFSSIHQFSLQMNALQTQLLSSLKNLDLTMENAQEMASSAKLFMEDTQSAMSRFINGEGTLGRFLSNDEIYLQARSVMTKVETLMNDVNHYGILFHNNKSWQRQRTKRRNLIEQLSTPKEFYDYFQEEVDEISTSLSRVSMLLEKANHSDHPPLKNQKYKQMFHGLINQVEALEENLKNYDQELIDYYLEN